MSDLPAVRDDPETKDVLPKGTTVIHAHLASQEIWRLCCRLRMDMRDGDLNIKDALLAVLMSYPDLNLDVKRFKRFMEDYVDTAIVIDPSFWKKGLMKSQARLNTVLEASKIADRMNEAFENLDTDEVKPEDLPRYMLAGERAMKARERQFEMMSKVGMGPQTEQERATPTKGAPTINVQGDAHFSLADAVGGSFSRRGAIDVEGKEKAASSSS